MDPIVAVYEITLTIRAPEGTEVEAPAVKDIEEAVEAVVHAGLLGAGVNAIAKRSDR